LGVICTARLQRGPAGAVRGVASSVSDSREAAINGSVGRVVIIIAGGHGEARGQGVLGGHLGGEGQHAIDGQLPVCAHGRPGRSEDLHDQVVARVRLGRGRDMGVGVDVGSDGCRYKGMRQSLD
jgi:hypothetical protein